MTTAKKPKTKYSIDLLPDDATAFQRHLVNVLEQLGRSTNEYDKLTSVILRDVVRQLHEKTFLRTAITLSVNEVQARAIQIVLARFQWPREVDYQSSVYLVQMTLPQLAPRTELDLLPPAVEVGVGEEE